ncbi:RIP metalloprotease RseP [Caulobacter sp. CCUG 60055]|uniref:M50 family metallopeptidase n=1 Tax=Caulobacter sp. CCUG 60055 TaxID=2100090 RepID=UPI001FA72631|nr:M50 family metallopeptidase [Caulobacter sp. CCUG 60055]MCI3178838.1 RIP metalloprotease RseP [Caulobacter sp. CCUG 60055]
MIDFLHGALTTLVPFIFVLTIVVTVHELGHFLAAKSFGVAIDRFSIGFGRAILRWRDRSGVEWRIGWLPLGGYVRFSGDENAASVPDQEDLDDMRAQIVASEGDAAVRRYFHFKPLWQRAIVVAAGPIANFVLAAVLFGALLWAFGETIHPARISQVQPGSAAARAGFVAGDVVLKADRRTIRSFEDLERYVSLRADIAIDFTVERGAGVVHIDATPERRMKDDPIAGRQESGVLGLYSGARAGDIRHLRYGPIEALGAGAARTWDVLDTTLFYLGRLVRGQVSADQLGGPVRTAHVSGLVAKMGAEGAPDLAGRLIGSTISLLSFTAVLSVGIGFMNLLPVPVLDGGHLLFYAYESVARRPVGARVQAASYRVGLALLLALMLFATWNDLQRLSVFHFLSGLFS